MQQHRFPASAVLCRTCCAWDDRLDVESKMRCRKSTAETAVLTSPTPEVKRSKCPLSMENYCLNGDCVYIPHENIHYCRCAKGYSGARCMHLELVRQPMSKQDVALTVAILFLVVVGLLIVSFLIYRSFKVYEIHHLEMRTAEIWEYHPLQVPLQATHHPDLDIYRRCFSVTGSKSRNSLPEVIVGLHTAHGLQRLKKECSLSPLEGR
ncbi:uncharacterized protein LOC122539528 isoform X2 [Chiloscyllium plagiosum]|uniref:uncharacterized protein LOC122539528 isoform X2 n=1 Tax=Chiloscyllium plagiosum TaxID=36176 RepID=UPI001CB7B0C2|nr:uncharacterized protein LOC122539528 isoform X2 [Chiloscyllium plagiosum]